MKIQIKATQEAAEALKEKVNAILFSEVLVNRTWIKDIWVIECKTLAALEIALVLVHQEKAITLWDVIR